MPKGLRLTLGNAPATWHTVDGLPGYFHPDIAVPIGEIGAVDATNAKKHDKDEGCPVGLVSVTEKDLQRAREALSELQVQVKAALRSQRDVAPVDQVAAEVAAISDNEE